MNGREYVYIDSAVQGVLFDNAELIHQTKERWDRIRAEALSRKQSIALMREVAEEWNSKA